MQRGVFHLRSAWQAVLPGIGFGLLYFPIGIWLRIRADRQLAAGKKPSLGILIWNGIVAEELIRGVAVLGLAVAAISLAIRYIGPSAVTVGYMGAFVLIAVYIPCAVAIRLRRERGDIRGGQRRTIARRRWRIVSVAGAIVGIAVATLRLAWDETSLMRFALEVTLVVGFTRGTYLVGLRTLDSK